MLSACRIVLIAAVMLAAGGYLLARAYFPWLTGGKAAIGLLAAEAALGPVLIVLWIRRRDRRKRALGAANTPD